MSLKEDDYNAWVAELRSELDAGHPVTGAYDADAQAAAAQCNAVNRTITATRDRDWIRTQFLRLGAGTWARLFDDARQHTRYETDESPAGGVTRQFIVRESRAYPSTADFVGMFESSSVSVGAPLNMRALPIDALLTEMADVDNTISGGAADTARELSDEPASRAVELWGADTVDADAGATVLQFREPVTVTIADVETARAL